MKHRGSALDDLERAAIVRILRRCQGIQKDAAKVLRISPRVMSYKVRYHGIGYRKFPSRQVYAPGDVDAVERMDPEVKATLRTFIERVLAAHIQDRQGGKK